MKTEEIVTHLGVMVATGYAIKHRKKAKIIKKKGTILAKKIEKVLDDIFEEEVEDKEQGIINGS